MKLKKFLAFALMAATALNFTACSDDDDDDDNSKTSVESVKLSENYVEIEVGKTATIAATVEPKDADVKFEWTIDDESIVQIVAGDDEEEVTIKGVKAGEATLKVTAGDKSKTCIVSVTKKSSNPNDPITDEPIIGDFKYFVISMPEAEFDKIADNALDMRVNDADMFYYPWENTYKTLEVSTGWGVEVVENTTWSGLGFNYQNLTLLANMSKITEDNGEGWYFHISLKVNSTVPQIIGLGSESGKSGEYKFAINGDYDDNGVITKKFADVPVDGEFHDVEVPMTNAIKAGAIYSNKPTQKPNLVFILSGGVAGTQIYFDNIYFYKK